jgi:hypothetical protein
MYVIKSYVKTPEESAAFDQIVYSFVGQGEEVILHSIPDLEFQEKRVELDSRRARDRLAGLLTAFDPHAC